MVSGNHSKDYILSKIGIAVGNWQSFAFVMKCTKKSANVFKSKNCTLDIFVNGVCKDSIALPNINIQQKSCRFIIGKPETEASISENQCMFLLFVCLCVQRNLSLCGENKKHTFFIQ